MQRPRPSARQQLTAFGRYARSLPGFMRSTIGPAEARERLRGWPERRSGRFLDLLERGVYANPGSPYLRLLDSAGIELGDVRKLIGGRGVEGTLEVLREAGVYATLDEFKGRAPVTRDGFSFEVSDRDFDNPLVAGHYWGTTGGSRGKSRQVAVHLQGLEHDSIYHVLFRESFGLAGRPFGIWRVIPPSRAGLNNYLYQLKAGGSVQRWFNPYRAPRDLENLGYSAFTAFTLAVGRRFGGAFLRPEHCPTSDAVVVARWLAECRAADTPAILDAQAGLGVRAFLAAEEEGLDVSGTFVRVGGEPFTEAKARAVEATGSRAVCHYAMSEVGRVGLACGDPEARDDVHLMTDKLALVQRQREVGEGLAVGALHYTTLLPLSPKLMINVESDDYATVTERGCDCEFGRARMTTHLHGIRSYEKLTTDSNHFLGSDLQTLVEEVLPRRFGGGPTDYQLVEEEVGSLPTLSVVVGLRVGEVSDAEVLSAVFGFLREQPRNRLMADFWAQSDSVRVVRREPVLTSAGKILPLHLGSPG